METKIGLCIPFRTKVSLTWAANLVNTALSTVYRFEMLVSKHYSLDKARNDLILAAKNMKCSHVVFLDSDIIPNVYVNGRFLPFYSFINHLVELDYPIVSGIYYSKKEHLAIYDYTGDEEIPFKPSEKKFEDFAEKVSYVDGIPMGLCLIKMEVFDELKDKGYFPWFEYKTIYGSKKIEVSEDLNFCLKVLKVFGKKSIMVWGYLVGLHETSVMLYPNGKMAIDIFGEY